MRKECFVEGLGDCFASVVHNKSTRSRGKVQEKNKQTNISRLIRLSRTVLTEYDVSSLVLSRVLCDLDFCKVVIKIFEG